MARIEDIERRLLNWARWKIGGSAGGLGYASVNLAGDTSRELYREARIPTNDCEAEETDRAVVSLDSDLRRTVEVVYLGSGGTRNKAAALCCTEATVYARVDRAHRLLAQWFTARQRDRAIERDRLDALRDSRKL